MCSLGQQRIVRQSPPPSPRRRGTTGFTGLRNLRICECMFAWLFKFLHSSSSGRWSVHAYEPGTGQEQRATTAIATSTTTNGDGGNSETTSSRPREECTVAGTRAIYGRVRQIRREKPGLSQISRYARNPGPICNAIKAMLEKSESSVIVKKKKWKNDLWKANPSSNLYRHYQ